MRVKPNLAVEIYAEDLAVQGAAGRLYDRIGKDGWQVDVLINNAGFGMVGAAQTLDMEKEDPFRVGTSIGSGIGSLQAMEAIKYLIGVGELLTGKLLTFEALRMEFHTIKLPDNHKTCAICGDHPSIDKLIDYEQVECDGK